MFRHSTRHFNSMPAPTVYPASIFTIRNRPPNRRIDRIDGPELGELWESFGRALGELWDPQMTAREPPGDPEEPHNDDEDDMMWCDVV